MPEFADVAFKMYPGQLSNPVKTAFGTASSSSRTSAQADPGIREGQGADRGLPDAQGADRICRQAAPGRQDRTSRPGQRAEEELTASPLKSSCPLLCRAFAPLKQYDTRERGWPDRPATMTKQRHDHRRLPARARAFSRHAAGRRRADRHRRRRHPLCRAHRRAAGAARSGHHGGRRARALEMSVRAGRLVPRPSQGRRGRRARRQFGQRQRLRRQIRA